MFARLLIVSMSLAATCSAQLNSRPNGHIYRHLQTDEPCLVTQVFPNQITCSLRARETIRDTILVDVSHVGTRHDLILRAVARTNRSNHTDEVLRFVSRATGAVLADIDRDGWLDVVTSSEPDALTHLWSPETRDWLKVPFPPHARPGQVCWGIVNGRTTILTRSIALRGAWQFQDHAWIPAHQLTHGLELHGARILTHSGGHPAAARLIDVDDDGTCELIADHSNGCHVLQWSDARQRWIVRITLPEHFRWHDEQGRDSGLRFIDLDRDGDLDIVHSNAAGYAIYLFTSFQDGWSEKLLAGDRTSDSDANIPALVLEGRRQPVEYDSQKQAFVRFPAGDSGPAEPLALPELLARRRIERVEKRVQPGFQALLKNEGGSDEWYNFAGDRVPNHHLRQTQLGAELVWETPAVSISEDASSVDLLFLGAMGYRGQPATEGFAFTVGDSAPVPFDLAHGVRAWTNPTGDVSLMFEPTWKSDQDAAGFFFVSVSRARVRAGEPLRLRVRSLGQGSRRWFALHPVVDSLGARKTFEQREP